MMVRETGSRILILIMFGKGKSFIWYFLKDKLGFDFTKSINKE
jgi:hypothetical protein